MSTVINWNALEQRLEEQMPTRTFDGQRALVMRTLKQAMPNSQTDEAVAAWQAARTVLSQAAFEPYGTEQEDDTHDQGYTIQLSPTDFHTAIAGLAVHSLLPELFGARDRQAMWYNWADERTHSLRLSPFLGRLLSDELQKPIVYHGMMGGHLGTEQFDYRVRNAPTDGGKPHTNSR